MEISCDVVIAGLGLDMNSGLPRSAASWIEGASGIGVAEAVGGKGGSCDGNLLIRFPTGFMGADSGEFVSFWESSAFEVWGTGFKIGSTVRSLTFG